MIRKLQGQLWKSLNFQACAFGGRYSMNSPKYENMKFHVQMMTHISHIYDDTGIISIQGAID